MKTRIKTPRSLMIPLSKEMKFTFISLIQSIQSLESTRVSKPDYSNFPTDRAEISNILQTWIDNSDSVWIIYIESIVNATQTVKGKGNIPIGIVSIINNMLSISIHPDYRNYGYGTECGKAGVKEVFENCDFVSCVVNEKDDKCGVRVVEKLGFRPKEFVGDRNDIMKLYSIMKTEFIDLWTLED